MTIEFQPWPKIARLNRNIVVTEKIDGTNAAVIVSEELAVVGAQSRSRLITPEDDNFGFARWVQEHAESLAACLGPGRHFGEWWGSGIQRKYGLANGEKRFSLFNTSRHERADFSEVPGLGVVPVLYEGPNDNDAIDEALDRLDSLGSVAAPGFMDPEGIVVFHSASRTMFKVAIKGDEAPKSMAGAA
ncbi:MAG: RNA ligase family protein [Mycetocola sp.]